MIESDKSFYSGSPVRESKVPDSIKVHSKSELKIFPGKNEVPVIPDGTEPYTEFEERRETKIVPPKQN